MVEGPRPIQALRVLRGLSFVEVMNFAALAAVLSAVAMYGFAKYVRHSKVAEATSTTARIAEKAVAFYDTSDSHLPAGTDPQAGKAMRHFPPASRTSVPGDIEQVRGKQYQSTGGDWAVSPWSDLGFSINQAQYYSYSFDSSGGGMEAKAAAVAQGDLDGDGARASFRLGIVPDETFHAKIAAEAERQNAEE